MIGASLVACSGVAAQDASVDASVDVATCDAQLPADAGPIPSFAAIQQIFNASCAVASSCHNAEPNTMTSLQLDPVHSYAELVGVPSDEMPGAVRVDPCHPETSWLMLKVDGSFASAAACDGGTMSSPCGVAMPKPPESALAASQIEMIRLWIAAGARSQ